MNPTNPMIIMNPTIMANNESNDNESNDNESNYKGSDINSLQMKSITFNRERSVSENTEDN